MPTTTNGFGIGDLSYVPTGLLDSLYQYLTFGPNLQYKAAYDQAYLGMLGQQNQLDAAARAQAAQAQVAAAQIGAQGGIQQQQIASLAQLRSTQAQIQGDLVRAAGGDRNAALRLQAELGQAAQIQNQMMRQWVAQNASSTGLRDALSARNFVRGVGNQPGFGSAMLAGPMKDIVAPTVGFAEYGAAPSIDMSLPSGGLGNISLPSFNFNGGSSMPKFDVPSFDLSNLVSEILKGVQPGSAIGPTSAVPNRIFYGPNGPMIGGQPIDFNDPAIRNQIPRFEGRSFYDPRLPQNPNTPVPKKPIPLSTPGLAKGGRLPVGEARLIGENGPEILHLKPDGTIDVIPLTGAHAYGASIQVSGRRRADDPNRSDAPILPPRGVPNTRPNDVNPLNPRKPPVTPPPGWIQWPDGSWHAPNDPAAMGNFPSPSPSGSPSPRPVATRGVVMAPVVPPAPPTNPAPPAPPSTPLEQPGGTTTVTTPDGTTVTTGQPPAGPTQTGAEIQSLPAFQALMGNLPGGYNANQTFDLPEYGLTGLPGIAQSAALFRPGILNPQEQADLMTLFGIGYNVPPEVIQSIINAYTPGYRLPTQAIGF